MAVSSRLIRSERHAEIGSLIRRDRGVVIDRWRRRAEEEQPNAKRVHREVLLDELDTFLAALGTSLAEAGDLESCRHCVSAVEHGEQRWETGWSLPELVRDYQLLRLVLLEYLDETLTRPIRCREVMAVGLALDEAIAASIGRYVASREEYIRQIERERAEQDSHEEEARLRRQAEALREEARRRDAFLATLGHELRNPLAPIRYAVHALHLKEPTPQTLDWAKEVVERQVQHMTRLVDDLLEISRITQGKSRLDRRPVDLTRLIRDTAEDQAGPRDEAGLTLTLDLPAEPVVVEGDPVRLTQVVGNLLHNATKFTASGGAITVGLARDQQAGRAVVTVGDTGIGIEPAELPHLFDAFRQAKRGQERSRGGLGLGLALVKGLVQLHGGEVRASSAGPGHGATFTFWLPLAPAAVPAETSATSPPVGKSLRILVVDDNRDSADSSRLLLATLGHQVAVAYSGPDAIRIAKQMQPDVVLCDIALPGMDGYAVADALRNEANAAGTRLIAVSGYGSQADARRCLEIGFERLMPKPVDPAELQRVLSTGSTPPAASDP
jgi:signal transduction histidine kinase/ActR/RegA family two-component response regulator